MYHFSVLISIYYKENPLWFREALDSVFAQTILPDEIVLIKDGPLTSELDSIIDEYSKKYNLFNIISNDINLGLGLSLQKGIIACKNNIIARMDTDDIMPNDRFEKQLSVIEKGYDVVSCWSLLFSENVSNVIAIKKRPENHNDIVKLAKRRSPVSHAASMMKRDSVLKAGNYQHCYFYEDYYLWARMIMSGSKFYNIQEVLYYVRTNEDQMKRRGGIKYLINELKVFKQFYNIGFYSIKDLIINSIIRIFTRLTPKKIRSILFKLIWNYK